MNVGEIYKLSDDRWRIEIEAPGHIYVLEIAEARRLAWGILWALIRWKVRRQGEGEQAERLE